MCFNEIMDFKAHYCPVCGANLIKMDISQYEVDEEYKGYRIKISMDC